MEIAFKPRAIPRQKTLRHSVQATGVGVHTGLPVAIALQPAEESHGLRFVRTDLEGKPEIVIAPAHVKAEAMTRMTVAHNPQWRGQDPVGRGASVGMIEHLLSACAGLGLTNLRVEINGFECPIFDGSATPYVRLIREAGLVDQAAPIRRFRLSQPIGLLKEKAEILAIPAGATRYAYFAEFRHAGLPDEQATFELYNGDYADEVAPARTFCFWKEIEGLLAAGLIKGGSMENAIVLKDGGPVRLDERQQPIPDERFVWRLPAELARHKLLDLIGDMAVLGGPLQALITARATGHAIHQEFVAKLAGEVVEEP